MATIGSSAIPYTLPDAGIAPDTAAVRNDTLVQLFDYDREGNRTNVNSARSTPRFARRGA